ncbi:LPXTG cell wall anchor domain-containing protein [Actinotignum sp. GS-2025e]
MERLANSGASTGAAALIAGGLLVAGSGVVARKTRKKRA